MTPFEKYRRGQWKNDPIATCPEDIIEKDGELYYVHPVRISYIGEIPENAPTHIIQKLEPSDVNEAHEYNKNLEFEIIRTQNNQD